MSSACRFLLWAVLGILALNGCGGGGGESGGFFPSSPDFTPSCSGASPTWTSTPDYESVASCVSQASLGDTINITAGEARWSQRLEMGTKRLCIIGAGIGETVITASSDGLGLFDLGTGGSRLAHMTISNPGGAIYVGGGQGFIIDRSAAMRWGWPRKKDRLRRPKEGFRENRPNRKTAFIFRTARTRFICRPVPRRSPFCSDCATRRTGLPWATIIKSREKKILPPFWIP